MLASNAFIIQMPLPLGEIVNEMWCAVPFDFSPNTNDTIKQHGDINLKIVSRWHLLALSALYMQCHDYFSSFQISYSVYRSMPCLRTRTELTCACQHKGDTRNVKQRWAVMGSACVYQMVCVFKSSHYLFNFVNPIVIFLLFTTN